VTYTQENRLFPASETTDEMTKRFVRDDDGVWRWFFGTDADALDDLPANAVCPRTRSHRSR